MKSHISRALCLVILTVSFPASAQEARPVLSLHEAIKTALEKSPAFAATINRTEAMTAASAKAGALPNPEMSVEAENFGGEGAAKGFDGAEITYGVSQLIEMPGKRSGRHNIAKSEESRSVFERDAARLDLIQNVVTAYAGAVAAGENLNILKEERSLAAEVHKSVVAKVDAGKEPPIQKSKAGIALASSEIAVERAQRSVAASEKILANLIGGGAGYFTVAAQTLPVMKAPLGLAAYTEMVKSSPDNRAYDARIKTAQSALSLEKANTVPDPTINVGLRDSREDDDQAFVAGVSFPFPVFDMNRAGIRRAGHEYNAAMFDKIDARLSSENDLVKSYESFSNAYREHEVLTQTVLPGAEEAFRVAREGYNAGKFGYLEVLDAQRTLFEARKQSIQTKLDYYKEMAAIDRLTAIHALSKEKKTP